MSKRDLSERDICTKYILPALVASRWDVKRQIREEYAFTAGRILDRGKLQKRGDRKRADYVLFYKSNVPLAIIEAKDNKHSVGAGMQQGLAYAEALDVPFVYSSNGDGFVEHDRTGMGQTVEREVGLDGFPAPDELWDRYRRWKGLDDEAEEVVLQDYHTELDGKEPRYYQRVAINRAVEAVVKGKRRALLVMATGTGKTFTAFQIIWRLWKAGRAKRVLFLADRNILVDQARVNDFRPFGDKMTKVQNREANKAFEVYLSLYQAITGSEARQDIYKRFSRDFFDLIVIDECHRGSAREESAWREILDYFDSAIHLGLTATPKETHDVSNIDYFGEPIYTYSLKQGIEDGFLAPYRVVRITLDRDMEGWRPEDGQLDVYGEEVEDRIYNRRDFDRTIVIDDRTETVARKVAEYMRGTDRFQKAIVFCVNIDHAERMRQALVNENADLAHADMRYVMRITGDNEEGKRQLDNFIDPESRYPVIVTTSKLLTTGVDAQTCKLIVLDAPIQSMTEFKQIIGRGTRIREDYGKRTFTIMDFRGVTDLFADPDFDGEPVQVYEPKEDEPPIPPDLGDEGGEIDGEGEGIGTITGTDGGWTPAGGEVRERQRTYRVRGVVFTVINERVQYNDPKTGKLITESLKDYTRKNVRERFASLQEFLQEWNGAERKQAIIAELEEHGILLHALQEEVGKDFDPFDLILHVAYDRPALTRSERARRVREDDYFSKFEEPVRRVLETLLDKYADEGVEDMEDPKVLKVHPFQQFGSPLEIVRRFGGKRGYQRAVRELEDHLYEAA